MKLRIKIVLIVLTVFGLLFFAISKALTKIERDNFQKLENQTVTENINRVEAAVKGRSDDLAVQLTNWSQWNDTYDFVQDGNQDYIDLNLTEVTFKQMHLNFMIFKNESGDIMFKKYLQLDLTETAFPEGLQKVVSDLNIPLEKLGDPQTNISGIINTPDGPYVLAIQSIISTDVTQPAKGLIIFGYAVDDTYSAALSKATYLNMDFSSYESAPNQDVFTIARQRLSLSNPKFIESDPRPDFIDGFVLIPDILGDPSVIFRAHILRDINKVGLDNIKRLNALLISIEILQIVVILILLEVFVLRKIVNLMKGVRSIGANDDNARLDVRGKDEFSQLSTEINKMLDALSQIKVEKTESEVRFMNIADMAPVMIWISDFQNKFIYVNHTLTEFFGKSENEFFGDAWTKVIHPDDVAKVLRTFKDSAEKKAPISVKYRAMCSKKVYRWIHVQAVIRETSQGIFKGYNGIAVDITEFHGFDLKQQNNFAEIENLTASMMESELKIKELEKRLRKRDGLSGQDIVGSIG